MPGKHAGSCLPHDETLVETRVVGNEVAIARELGQCRDRILWARRILDIVLCDARELDDFRWYGETGIDEGVELAHGLAAAHADGGYFEQRTACRVKPGGFGVEHDDLVLDEAELQVPRPLRKLTVHVGNFRVRSRDEKLVKSYFT